MSNQDQPTPEPEAQTASERLGAGVAGLRVPDQSADIERTLIRVGMALPLVGLVILGVAWYGASGTGYVADQVPYLISGGLGGLGLVLIGLGLFLRYAITHLFRFGVARLVHEQQAQTDRIVEAMGSLEQAIRGVTDDVPAEPAPTEVAGTGAGAHAVRTTTGS